MTEEPAGSDDSQFAFACPRLSFTPSGCPSTCSTASKLSMMRKIFDHFFGSEADEVRGPEADGAVAEAFGGNEAGEHRGAIAIHQHGV